MKNFDVAIVGQGYAGLCAARAARARGLSVAAFESVMAGGAVMTVLNLDPSPEDFTHSGPDLGAIIGMDNMDAGVAAFLDPITAITPAPLGWALQSTRGLFAARHVIIATGTRPRALGLAGEAEFNGKGISHCADCDGPQMVGRDCVVVGGGDAAFQEAAILARVARSVTLVLRGPTPRARPDLVEKALAHAHVTMLTGLNVIGIEGADHITAVTLDGAPHRLACQGLFPFIGGEPVTDLLPRDAHGGLMVDGDGRLPLPGLWAIGSVRAGFSGGLVQAGEDAARAIAAIG